VLPSELPDAAGAVGEALSGLPAFTAGAVADAMTGLLGVRWHGPRESVDDPLAALRGIAAARGGTGRLLHLPAEARRRHRHRLVDDPNDALEDALLAAFDPHGTFARRRP
jgi:hypothetical protein